MFVVMTEFPVESRHKDDKLPAQYLMDAIDLAKEALSNGALYVEISRTEEE